MGGKIKTKKSKVAGFNFYERPNKKLKNTGDIQNNVIRPSNFHTMKEDNKVIFQLYTGSKWLRFLPNPLFIRYLFWENLPDKDGSGAKLTKTYANAASKYKGTEALAFPYRMDPSIAGSILFEDYKVFINRNLMDLGRHVRRDQV